MQYGHEMRTNAPDLFMRLHDVRACRARARCVFADASQTIYIYVCMFGCCFSCCATFALVAQEKQKNDGVLPEGVFKEVIHEYNKVSAVRAKPLTRLTCLGGCLFDCGARAACAESQQTATATRPVAFAASQVRLVRVVGAPPPQRSGSRLVLRVRAQFYVGFDGAARFRCAAKR